MGDDTEEINLFIINHKKIHPNLDGESCTDCVVIKDSMERWRMEEGGV